MFDGLREELTAAKMRDPAARSSLEILCCYPGIWAILFHRVNHWLWTHHLPFWGRFFSQISRFLTGIEIKTLEYLLLIIPVLPAVITGL